MMMTETDVGWVQSRAIQASSRTRELHDSRTGQPRWLYTAHTTTCSTSHASDGSGSPSPSPTRSNETQATTQSTGAELTLPYLTLPVGRMPAYIWLSVRR